jgi:hypothetical protein
MKNVKVVRFSVISKMKAAVAASVSSVAEKLNESVEKDKIASLANRKEKLELEKIGVLAKLEQIEKDLFWTKKELESMTIEVPLEAVPA